MREKTNKEMRILIVDDEIEIRELVEEQLNCDGFSSLFLAANGREALEILQREPIDLVLADLLMPKMNGMELHLEIRKMAQPPKFVLVTGSDLEDVSPKPDSTIELIQKPFDFDEFVKRVNEICLNLLVEKAQSECVRSLHPEPMYRRALQ